MILKNFRNPLNDMFLYTYTQFSMHVYRVCVCVYVNRGVCVTQTLKQIMDKL